MLWVFIKGFSVSMGLILAIGAQNAFVLKQGIKKVDQVDFDPLEFQKLVVISQLVSQSVQWQGQPLHHHQYKDWLRLFCRLYVLES